MRRQSEWAYAGRSIPEAAQSGDLKAASLVLSRSNARVSSSRISCSESGLSFSSRLMLSRWTANSPIWRAPRVSGSTIKRRSASGIRRRSRTGVAVVANGKSRLPVVIQWTTNSSTWAGQQAPYTPSCSAISSCHCRILNLSSQWLSVTRNHTCVGGFSSPQMVHAGIRGAYRGASRLIGSPESDLNPAIVSVRGAAGDSAQAH
jgi:hypothetical protein